MKRLLTSLVMTTCFLGVTFAQDQTEKALKETLKKKEIPVSVSSVNSSVSVEAVLIPYNDARRIFGKPIAKNYAVVELNIGNKSPDSELLIQNVYIDYTRWVFSGMPHDHELVPPSADRFGPYQTSANPGRVASEEARLVRDRLQNASLFSGRSWTMRALDLAANIAGAYPFGLSKLEVRYFGVFSGNLVPGIEKLWPDDTRDQLLRITDYGFKSNKNISRRGSDIIVCFFPIDRFLTPGFRKLYLKSPALFFAPLEMMADITVQKDVAKVLGRDLGMDLTKQDIRDLHRLMPCYIKLRMRNLEDPMDDLMYSKCLSDFGLVQDHHTKKPKVCDPNKFNFFVMLDYLAQTSLNSVFVTVDGVMTLDTSAFAAKIDTIAFDKIDGCGDDTSSCFWTDMKVKGGVRTGTISGSYLTGGAVAVAEADLNLKDVTTVAEESNDQLMHFSFTLTNPIATGKKLTFTVTKTQAGPNDTSTKELKSPSKEYVVTYTNTLKDPTIDTNVVVNDMASPFTVTLTGKNLSDKVSGNPTKITFHTPGNNDIPDVKPSTVDDNSITLPLPADTQFFGCWSVTVKVGSKEVTQRFVVPPSITSAVIAGTGDSKKLTIAGAFLDAKDCQTPSKGLEFQLQNGNLLIPLSADQVTDKKVTIPLTGKAADAVAAWTLHIKFNGGELKQLKMQ
ncbi:MAG: hypothetical protein QOH41_1002 [Blastocatellia bacterium]|jgi:hypothetical protein|nr:hypothetical protein [Blastocatellia bacterium]